VTLDSALVYDYGVMDTAIADINNAETNLHQIESEIKSDLARLGETWTEGTDHQSYVAYQAAWDKIFEDVKQALTGLRMVATGCLDNAKANEAKCAGMWPAP
jgi:WXG100 family type VII secretion target